MAATALPPQQPRFVGRTSNDNTLFVTSNLGALVKTIRPRAVKPVLLPFSRGKKKTRGSRFAAVTVRRQPGQSSESPRGRPRTGMAATAAAPTATTSPPRPNTNSKFTVFLRSSDRSGTLKVRLPKRKTAQAVLRAFAGPLW